MWTTYRVRWEFVTQLCASVPGDPKMVEKWLGARAPSVRPPHSKSLDEIGAEVIASQMEPEEEQEYTTLVFQRVNGVLAVRMATIKAHLKDCARQLQNYMQGYVKGDATLRVKVANGVYWPPADKDIVTLNGTPFTPILTRDGKPVTEASGVRQKAIHVMTPTGPRSAIKTFEVVENAVIEFPLSILTAPARQVKRGKEILSVPGRPLIHDDDLKQLFLYGGVHGYGGERSEDGGRYAATHEREDA